MNGYQRATGAVLMGGILLFGGYGVLVNALEGQPQYVQDEVYQAECGACHLAYAPDLLPVESWRKIMTDLEDHFGDNAELDDETASHIEGYLEDNGLSRERPSKMSRLLRGLPADPPMRITELPAFVNMHYMIPRELEVDELAEGFLSPCADCHKEALLGIYDAERLHPGYGPGVWDGKPANRPE
jgi:hypothetical protein